MAEYNYNNQYNQYQSYSNNNNYDPNAYSNYYNQSSYDPNAYANYSQQGGYDPNAYSNYSQQSGYDPNTYSNYSQQGGYDPNYYANYYQTQNPSDQNPVRVNVTPNSPATSSNNITLNLESLYEKLKEDSKPAEVKFDYNIGIKNFLYFSYNNGLINKLFSNLCDSDSFIAYGPVTSVNNSTVSISNKIVALKFINYIEIDVNTTTDMIISSFFTSTPQPTSLESNEVDEMFTFLYSKKSFNQYISICIDSTFLTTLSQLVIVELNYDIVILRSDTSYIIMPINKIVSIE